MQYLSALLQPFSSLEVVGTVNVISQMCDFLDKLFSDGSLNFRPTFPARTRSWGAASASRVSRERLRKLRIFQRSGYISLDLAAGTGEFFRLRGDFDPMLLARAPRALEEFVERVPLEAPDGEPLVLELSQFLGAIAGRHAVAVTGEEGREALEAALRIVAAIEAAHRVMRASDESARA
jgi:predicted dehydrogenase